ncbi:MAG TPA: DUF4062 domain-containing protein [Symbiobacteriaceae bacterium]|nr:DUF4062 domain-containing protein [Symbiobacteriaceae bacterium]
MDLRWGIIEEHDILDACLAEAGNCQAFVGLLGERYGTVPITIPEALFERSRGSGSPPRLEGCW